MQEKENLQKLPIPKHIAIIMDGNGRWAKEQGKDRIQGHKYGVASVREVVEGCSEIGIPYLTLYAFSTENWKRPKYEVDALMSLLVSTIRKEINDLKKNNVKLHIIGDWDALPKRCQRQLGEGLKMTRDCSGVHLILALSYSSQWEIINAVKRITTEVKEGNLDPKNINDQVFRKYLCTSEFPDPELMIRTGGEHRISNFLLYQSAYTELYFVDKHWPDFRKPDLFEAIANFQHRERRFGKTSEQIQNIQ